MLSAHHDYMVILSRVPFPGHFKGEDAMTALDHIEIEQQVRGFADRDLGHWDSLLQRFHPEGRIQVSWYRGPFTGFVEAARQAQATVPLVARHRIGASRIQINGTRAVADTDVTIVVRAPVEGEELETTSYARFHDWFEKRDGVWRILSRVCIYDRDRIEAVGNLKKGREIIEALDTTGLPLSHRFLVAVQMKMGAPAPTAVQVDVGTEREAAIFASDTDWLETGKIVGDMAIETH